jgi:phenylacetic acid degradation operon negative regulatory protein
MASTAKRIVLELMSASPDHEGSSAALVACGELLGISENNVRVTLARLLAAGTLETSSRGTYRIAASAITRHVSAWRELEKLVRRWDGGWACVQLQPLTDRAAARNRARALKLLGFRSLARGLDVRPDNLAGGVPALRERLVELGRDRDALVYRATDLDAATEQRARALWDSERLTASYVHTTERIERWLANVEDEPRAAAREAFFFGGDVLRKIIFDPRLPEPLVDVAARKTMLDAAARLDTYGRRLWSRLYGQEELRRVA